MRKGVDSNFLRVTEIVGDDEKAAWLDFRSRGKAGSHSIMRDGLATPVVDARSSEDNGTFDFDIVLVETSSGDRLAVAMLSTARVLRIAMPDSDGVPNVIAAVSSKSMKRLKILRNNLEILLSIGDLLSETRGAFVWK